MDADRFTPLHRGGSGPPLVCLHGFTDTWRSWELVLPELECHHDVLALTLLGHAGGPPLGDEVSADAVADAVEAAMDEAGFQTAHVVGNSLGGYLALKLATRGRATSVVALAPAGGWAPGDPAFAQTQNYFLRMQELLAQAIPHVDAIVASPEGRRRATEYIATNYEHIPPDLVAHLMLGAARCDAVMPFIEHSREEGWPLEAGEITCPVRMVWGTADRILEWPTAAVRYREGPPAQADWVVLDDVGHCPQIDVPLETAQLIVGFTAR